MTSFTTWVGPFQRVDSMPNAKKPTDQEPAIRTVAMPADANPNGDIFGGWLLSQMDVAGGVHANHVAGGRVVTIGIEAMTFHKPVYIGDQVSCYCQTKEIGNTSVAVKVETWVCRQDSRDEKVTEGLFTYVAIDINGQPRPVVDKHQ